MSNTTSEVLTHQCPNCGGALKFNPEDGKVFCEYCLSHFTEEEVLKFEEQQRQATNLDHSDANAQESATTTEADQVAEPSEDLVEFHCPSCGAQIVATKTTAADFCYYCHNPVILQERISGKFTPKQIIPFQVEKKTAQDLFLSWIKKKWFLPRDFKNSLQSEKLVGVYFPYWNISSEQSGAISGTGEEIDSWISGNTEYTRTKIYDFEYSGTINFRNYLQNALASNCRQVMLKDIEPYNFAEALDFKSQYLAGFLAEKRDLEFADLEAEVQKNLVNYNYKIFRDSLYRYDCVRNLDHHYQIQSLLGDYCLLPVYILTYRSALTKKVSYFVVNGQTGKVSGVLPYSKIKTFLFSLMIAFFAFLVVILIACLILYLWGRSIR